MGTLTYCFAATSAQLRAYYPTWKLPLNVPNLKESKNPFTKETLWYEDWDPEPARPVEGNGLWHFEAEQDLHRHFQGTNLKGLFWTDLEDLIPVLHSEPDEWTKPLRRPPLIGPEKGPWVNELPGPFVARLAALGGEDVEPRARDWLYRHLRKERGKSLTSAQREKLSVLTDWLAELASLARVCIAVDERIYIWSCL
jgi:hypothetical protein